jgi:isopentenyl-diphosphate delta-isomerase
MAHVELIVLVNAEGEPTGTAEKVSSHHGDTPLAPGESFTAAIERRLDYELGMTADNIEVVIPDYRYRTPPFRGIVEHEFCPVFIARATSEPRPNRAEVAAYLWMGWPEFVNAALSDTAGVFSWWCKNQLTRWPGPPAEATRALPPVVTAPPAVQAP